MSRGTRETFRGVDRAVALRQVRADSSNRADNIVLNTSELREPDRLFTWLDNDSNRELTSRGRVGFPLCSQAEPGHLTRGPRSRTPLRSDGSQPSPIENTRHWSRPELEHGLDALHPTIVRVEGPVRVEDASQPTVVQAVGAAWVLDEFPEPPATAHQLIVVSIEARDDLKTRSPPFR